MEGRDANMFEKVGRNQGGMLEGQVQDDLLRAGLGREAVGTVVGKAIWGGPMDCLEIWIEKFSFDFVHMRTSPRFLSRGTTCRKSAILGQYE